MQNCIDGDLGVNIFPKKGVILSSHVKSETHVSSHGGGGYLYEETGQVSAPTIKSTIRREQEIWIKGLNGVEECIRLKECDLQVRQGHKVTFILAGRQGEDTVYYTILVNNDTAKWSQIASASDLVSRLKLIPDEGCGCVSLITLFLGVGILCFSFVAYQETTKYHSLNSKDPTQMTALVPIGGLLLIWSYLSITRRKRKIAWRNQFVAGLQSHLARLGRETVC